MCFSVQRYQEKHQKGVIAFKNNKKSIKIYIFLCLYRNGTAFSNFIPNHPKNPYRYVSKYKRHVLFTLYRNGLYRNVVHPTLTRNGLIQMPRQSQMFGTTLWCRDHNETLRLNIVPIFEQCQTKSPSLSLETVFACVFLQIMRICWKNPVKEAQSN